jgi:hypothetical protein
MTMTPQSWARDLLTRLGYPVGPNNMAAVLAWEYQEGGHFANDARLNPLNTTLDHARYGAINSVGVARYPYYETGCARRSRRSASRSMRRCGTCCGPARRRRRPRPR